MLKYFVFLLLTPLALTGPAFSQTIDLQGQWLVCYKDSADYAKFDCDDSAWSTVRAPGDWSPAGKDYDGTGWLRLKFRVPRSIQPQDMILQFGKVDDEDQTYFNGEMIGATKGWNKPRSYAIPMRLIRFGQENCIAVRVYDEGGGGGILEAPVILRTAEESERGKLTFYSIKDRKPIFSDNERKAMPLSRPFRFTWVHKDGILVPRINGRGLWGTAGLFSNEPARQAYYEAPILAQQGWNNLRVGVRPVGYTLNDWLDMMPAFDREGIACIWSAYSMADDFIAQILGVPEDALGKTGDIILENGERKQNFGGAGCLGNPWNPEFLKNSDAMWERMTGAMRFKTCIGYQVTNEIYMENGSYDPYARRDWQQFLKSLFKDDTPAEDSSGDGTCFDKAYGKSYRTWDEVEQFRSADLKDPAAVLLKDMWLGATYAGYVQREAAVIHKRKPEAMVSPCVCVPVSASVDLSLICSMPDINVAFINTYGCWLGGGLLMAAIADTYGRPAVASEINYPAGNYQQMKWTALTMLPYYEGFQWFGYNQKDGTEQLEDEMASEYGGKYGLIDHGMVGPYDGDGDKRHAGEVSKATQYDPRFAVIPQLAPFAGKLSAGIDKRILWITASGYRPDYEEDHSESQMFRANVTSDMAVALKPDLLSLKGKKVVIYRNIESPCISMAVYRKLRDYVRSGGTVVTGAYYIAAGNTLTGEDNKADWWQGLKPVRTEFSTDGSTTVSFGGKSLKTDGTHQYLIPVSPDIRADGKVTDSTGAAYPLVMVRREGNGKWVLINYPTIFRMSERVGGWQAGKYAERFQLLRAIVKKYAGVELPYRYEMQVYSGDRCGLAIKEPAPSGAPATPDVRPKFRASRKTVAFEIFEKKLDGGAYLEPKSGAVEIPEPLRPGDGRLWVLKPYGEPVLLYADGTEKHQGLTDDGVYRSGKLTFTFGECAYVSSPQRPKSATADGKALSFEYNEQNHLLVVHSDRGYVRAVVSY